MTLQFNEDDLLTSLNELRSSLRAAFAAACAERLFAAYLQLPISQISGNSLMLRAILNEVWDDLQAPNTSIADFDRKIDMCMRMMPSSHDPKWLAQNGPAEDALAAVIYALRCRRKGLSQDAAWAARRVYEALDDYLIRRQKIRIRTKNVGESILADRIIQAELERQYRDIKDLLDESTTVAGLRRRAMDEAIVFDSIEP